MVNFTTPKQINKKSESGGLVLKRIVKPTVERIERRLGDSVGGRLSGQQMHERLSVQRDGRGGAGTRMEIVIPPTKWCRVTLIKLGKYGRMCGIGGRVDEKVTMG